MEAEEAVAAEAVVLEVEVAVNRDSVDSPTLGPKNDFVVDHNLLIVKTFIGARISIIQRATFSLELLK